jgi:hypothetical protein
MEAIGSSSRGGENAEVSTSSGAFSQRKQAEIERVG